MEIKEWKLTCEFQSSADPQAKAQRYEGVAHLFEHHYNPLVTFWYGTMQLTTSDASFSRRFVFGADDPSLHITIQFEDGRQGVAELTETFFHDEWIEVAFVGHSPLGRSPRVAA
jgi:hypothetical protein